VPGTLRDEPGEPILQALFILIPRDTVDAGGRLLLQASKAFPQQIHRHMVEQGGEPFLLLLFRSTAHTLKLR
jgi:hypothetical protein